MSEISNVNKDLMLEIKYKKPTEHIEFNKTLKNVVYVSDMFYSRFLKRKYKVFVVSFLSIISIYRSLLIKMEIFLQVEFMS